MTALQAACLLAVALPICIWVALSDMREMRIPNRAVLALAAGFALAGLVLLPLDAYLWRWAQLAMVLAAGIILNAVGALGAGDAKFSAAAALYIAPDDLRDILLLFAACLLAGYVVHRTVKLTPLRRLVPDWQSWETGKRFPMGFPLAATLVIYLAAALVRAA